MGKMHRFRLREPARHLHQFVWRYLVVFASKGPSNVPRVGVDRSYLIIKHSGHPEILLQQIFSKITESSISSQHTRCSHKYLKKIKCWKPSEWQWTDGLSQTSLVLLWMIRPLMHFSEKPLAKEVTLTQSYIYQTKSASQAGWQKLNLPNWTTRDQDFIRVHTRMKITVVKLLKKSTAQFDDIATRRSWKPNNDLY